MNYFDDSNPVDEEGEFKDVPDEVEGKEAARPNVQVQKPVRQAVDPQMVVGGGPKELPPEEEFEGDGETHEEGDYDDDSTDTSDALYRLELGRLYEMVMNHDLFAGVDASKKAVNHVQKQFRNYAREQMEIMLGMRQEPQAVTNAFPMELFPFNALEVDVLKMLASTATKGESRNGEPLGPQAPPPRTTLNPISAGSSKTKPVVKKPAPKPLAKAPMTPVRRKNIDARVQQILAEEGVTLEEVNEVFPPDYEPINPAALTEEQIIERNRNIRNKRVKNPNSAPFPTPEQMEMAIMQRAQTAEATKPGWRELMGMVKAMPVKNE